MAARTARLPRKTATAETGMVTTAPKAEIVGLASIPDPAILDTFINRELPGGISDFDLFDFCLRNRRNVLIEGPTGSGKTTSVVAYAAARAKRFYSVSSSTGIEPSQLFGKYIPTEDGSFAWQDGPVTDLVRHGGVLLLNEVNFIPERVGTVLFSLLDKRREIQLVDHKGEVIHAHPDLLIVADMNPDYEGTKALNKAFRNRYADQMFFDYDPKIEAALVKSGALLSVAKQFRDMIRQGQFETPVSTNMLMEFELAALDLSVEYAISTFCTHFMGEERDAVHMVLDAVSSNITRDINVIREQRRRAELGEPEPIEDDGTPGAILNDDEWGLLGVEWVFEMEGAA